MNEIWNEICFELKACIQNNVLEKEYENAVCNCLQYLGWKKFKGEIVTQYPVQAGHENKYADIVVLQDDVEQFVIEIKRPNHLLQEYDERQLFSYMRLLKHQVVWGLYIGDKIRLYYDDITSQQLPEHVFSIEIEENNPDGIKFVELFSKELFNVQTLTDFCKRQKEIFQEHKLIQLEVDRLLSDVNGLLFKDALKKKYLEEGHDEEWADSVLNQITLTVSPLAKIKKEVIQSVVPAYEPIQSTSTHDKTKYGFLGSRPLSKRKFVLNVVRQYVNGNPKTYSEYAMIFNALRPDSLGVIRKYDSLPINQHRNYFMKEDECLNSRDGIKFVVCNQWGIFNIRPVVQFAIAQGYNVVEYNN